MESEERFLSIIACLLYLIFVFLPYAESYSCNIEIPDKWCIGSPNWIHNLADCPNKPVISDAEPVTIEIRVIYKCKNSGKLFDGSQLYAQKTCSGNTSEWMGQVDPCKDINCGTPPASDNTTFTFTNTSLNGKATYKCDTGFELYKGDTTLTCQDNGRWSGNLPVCRQKLCPPPPKPPDGTVCVNSHLPGGVATYSCKAGYTIKPSTSRHVCSPSATWIGTTPICERVKCVPAPAFSYTTNQAPENATLGDITKYICISGYQKVKGDTEVVCQADSTWSGRKLICQRVSCPRPLVLPRSTMSPAKAGYVFEDFIRYTCDPGFEKIHGDSNRNCRADGKWSGVPPFCQEIRCPKLIDIPNAISKLTGRQYQDVAIYACSERHQLIGGDANRTCQLNGSWSGRKPMCSGCSEPAELPGVKRLTEAKTWDVNISLNYACDTGYIRVRGDFNRTCLKNGSWSGVPPVCREAVCPCLEQPPAGILTVSSYVFGGVARFTCLPGYRLTGSDTRKCSGEGSWTETNPKCSSVKCPVPPNVPQTLGKVHGLNFHQTVTYRCDAGYKLTRGDPTWSCLITGLWKGDVPICDVIECPSPEVIPNAKLLTKSNNYVVNTSIHYECDSGYQVKAGDLSRRCQTNGAWSGTALHCEEAECPEIPSFLNGTFVSSGRRYGDVAAFSCEAGYNLSDGSKARFCQANKTWSGEQPVCSAVTCAAPPRVVNAEAVSPQSSYHVGESVRYQCLTGYEHTGGSLDITCLPYGSWSDNLPFCSEIKCPSPSAMSNGRVLSHGIGFGDVATYQCDTGYTKHSGELFSYCQANKTWSTRPPSCTEVTCRTPPRIHNGLITNIKASYIVNDTVSYICDEGYKVKSGDTTWSCQDDGSWSGVPPLCVGISCPKPETIINVATIFTSLRFGYKAFHKCIPGYKMVGGSEVRSCQANGTWSGIPLRCSVISCQDPPQIPNAILKDLPSVPFIWNSTITYVCVVGFELAGGYLARNCSINGTWTGAPPICKEISCGKPTNISRGSVMFNGVTYGDIAFYKCDDGYKLTSGNETRKCLANGTWSEKAHPSCNPFSCNAPPVPGNVKIVSSPKSFVFNSRVVYECHHGYRHNGGNLTRVCQSDSQWSGDPPDCQEISCGLLPQVPFTSVTQNGDHYRAITVYACLQGYLLTRGDTKRVCQANGTWSGVAPVCKRITCPQPQMLANSRLLHPAKAMYQYDEKIQYSCDEGYEVGGGDTERTCLSQGSWSGIPLLCNAKSCGIPVVDDNTTATGVSTYFGSKLKYECITTYMKLGGDKSRTCQSNATWSGLPLQCQRIVCPKPTTDSLGLLEFSFSGLRPGDSVIYFCQTGLEGVRRNLTMAHCQLNGTWSQEAPRCAKIQCRDLENVTNSNVTLVGGDLPGANVTYTCRIGFELEGKATRLCLADGKWSGYPPKCRRIDCGFPKCARFSKLNGDGIKFGDKVSYQCDDEYFVAHGNTSRTCQSDRKWSGSPPQCMRVPVKEEGPVTPPVPEKKVGKKLVYPRVEAESAPEIGAAIIGVTLAFLGLIFFLDISTYYRNLRSMKRNVSHFLKSIRENKVKRQQEKDLEEWGEGVRRLNGVAKLSTNNSIGDETPSTSSDDAMVQLRSCKYATMMNTTRPVGTENLSVL